MQLRSLIIIFSLFLFSCEDKQEVLNVDNESLTENENENNCDDEVGDVCGCMDSVAINFNPFATIDDGTCQYYTGELNLVWSKTIEVAGEMWSMRPVSDGGFIMACGNAGDCENSTYDDPCEYYGQLIRLDENGDIIWHKMYENSSAIYAARETSDGGFIAAGWYECVRNMDCYPDMFILKTDADGNEEWSRIEASSNNNNDWGRDAIQTQDGNYVVAGTWNDDGWNSKASLRKYDINGDLMWSNTYSNSTANEAYELLETNEGDLVFAGYSGTQHGAYQHYMVKTDSDGEQKWKKKKKSVGDAILYAICESPDGGYTGAGFCNSWRSNFIIQRKPNQGSADWNSCIIGDMSVAGFYDITPAIGGGYYCVDERNYLTKLSSTGEIIFTENVGASLAVIELNNGDIVVAGRDAFLDGGYGGEAIIKRVSFSN